MFFLLFLALNTNLYLGFLVFSYFSRTKEKVFRVYICASSFCVFSTVILTKSQPQNLFFVLCSPLLIGFLFFLKEVFSHSKNRFKNFETALIFLEILSIHLKTGRSFTESFDFASTSTSNGEIPYFFLKKNVVMQQPKSRNCSIFYELKSDLNTLLQQSIGKKALLNFIKSKFIMNYSLEKKIHLSITQYKAQSFVLCFFWIAAGSSLAYSGNAFIYKKSILISLVMMLLGLRLARKLLVKTSFRI